MQSDRDAQRWQERMDWHDAASAAHTASTARAHTSSASLVTPSRHVLEGAHHTHPAMASQLSSLPCASLQFGSRTSTASSSSRSPKPPNAHADVGGFVTGAVSLMTDTASDDTTWATAACSRASGFRSLNNFTSGLFVWSHVSH